VSEHFLDLIPASRLNQRFEQSSLAHFTTAGFQSTVLVWWKLRQQLTSMQKWRRSFSARKFSDRLLNFGL